MNVNYPKDSEHLMTFGGVLILVGVGLCIASLKLKKIEPKDVLQQVLLPIALVGIGFIISFGPWAIKNGVEGMKMGTISINTLIW